MSRAYTLLISPTGRRSLKKLPKHIHQPLLEKTQSLQSDPLQGEKLKGELHFLRSLHTRMKNSDYRIVYEIIPEKLDIIIHYLATRENFYKELTRLRLKPGN